VKEKIDVVGLRSLETCGKNAGLWTRRDIAISTDVGKIEPKYITAKGSWGVGEWEGKEKSRVR